MASANTSWSKENLSCSICLEVFNSPVSTPCGHNFCRACVTKFWDDQVQYKCPVCEKLFQTKPDLQVNTLFSEMVDLLQHLSTKLEGTLRRSQDQLEEPLNMEMKKLQIDDELIVQQFEVEVTLDPDTAHSYLILSDDGKKVHDGGKMKNPGVNHKRFTQHKFVLTKQSFSSVRFYFEVQVKDKTKWRLGVTRKSVNRKDKIKSFTPGNGFWCLHFDKDKLYCNGNTDSLPVRAELQKVGVFVDYDAGLVSFYDVEARAHIYSATGCTFSEPLYLILSPCSHDGGRNSTPLIISPVNQTD